MILACDERERRLTCRKKREIVMFAIFAEGWALVVWCHSKFCELLLLLLHSGIIDINYFHTPERLNFSPHHQHHRMFIFKRGEEERKLRNSSVCSRMPCSISSWGKYVESWCSWSHFFFASASAWLMRDVERWKNKSERRRDGKFWWNFYIFLQTSAESFEVCSSYYEIVCQTLYTRRSFSRWNFF